MSRDRYKNTLATAGCCPFVIHRFLRSSYFCPRVPPLRFFRCCLSPRSFSSLCLSFSLSLTHSIFSSRQLRHPGRIFLLFQPFLFCPRRSQPSHAPCHCSRVYSYAYVFERVKPRAFARGGEPYVGLMSAIMT